MGAKQTFASIPASRALCPYHSRVRRDWHDTVLAWYRYHDSGSGDQPWVCSDGRYATKLNTCHDVTFNMTTLATERQLGLSIHGDMAHICPGKTTFMVDIGTRLLRFVADNVRYGFVGLPPLVLHRRPYTLLTTHTGRDAARRTALRPFHHALRRRLAFLSPFYPTRRHKTFINDNYLLKPSRRRALTNNAYRAPYSMVAGGGGDDLRGIERHSENVAATQAATLTPCQRGCIFFPTCPAAANTYRAFCLPRYKPILPETTTPTGGRLT